jgi:hypothetical protein
MNQDHVADCTALNCGSTQSLVKSYWRAKGTWNFPKALSMNHHHHHHYYCYYCHFTIKILNKMKC